MVAQHRGHLEDAETWYRKSLDINETLGNRPGMASSYHQLGMVAQHRGHLEDAETWYRKSLDIEETLGNRRGMATSYAQLGLLTEERRDAVGALALFIKGAALFDGFPHPPTGSMPHHIVRLTAELGMPVLESTWQQITNNPLPEPVRAFVEQAIQAGADGSDAPQSDG